MHYEFNISLNGSHFFGTHERSAQSVWKAQKVLAVLKEKFPQSEGYEVTCQEVQKTFIECTEAVEKWEA